ncbi:MAG: condensation domain-containing protein, partial [Pyrinomonadaceae bacterium]
MQETAIEGFRLSPQQRRLWSLVRQSPAAPYRTGCRVLLEGAADEAALRAALREVVRRHEVLRTGFRRLPGMSLPLQVIGQDYEPLSDVRTVYGEGAAGPGGDDEWRSGVEGQAASEPVDDGRLEARLVRLGVDRQMLELSLPAMCCDAVGLRNLVEEISRCYGAAVSGEPLADEPVQYVDLSEWQNELLEAETAAAGKAYWGRQDLTELESLKLPYRREVPQADFSTRVVSVNIDTATMKRVEALIEEDDSTAAAFYLTCWQVLLCRLTGQPRVTVGVCFDGRNYDGLDSAVGLFSRYLPLPTPAQEPAVTFGRLLGEVTRVSRECTEHQEYFNWEQFAAPAAGSPAADGYPCLYEYAEQPLALSAAGLSFIIQREHSCPERFHLRLRCLRSAAAVSAEFHYDQSLYDREDISRLAEEFATLVTSASSSAPRSPVSELEVVGERERRLLLHDWNDTAAEFPRHLGVHQLFERQARRTPDAPAVVCGDEALSYAELDARAEVIARRLRRLGVVADSRVALLLERSAAAI